MQFSLVFACFGIMRIFLNSITKFSQCENKIMSDENESDSILHYRVYYKNRGVYNSHIPNAVEIFNHL